MNFLDSIWMIPLFPLCGALAMLVLGKFLDPQAPSEVAVAPGVEPVADEHGHGHAHDVHAGHDSHAHPHSGPMKFLVSLLCPGMVLLSVIFSLGAVLQLAALPEKVHQVIQFTWLAGMPFHMSGSEALARFTADWARISGIRRCSS